MPPGVSILEMTNASAKVAGLLTLALLHPILVISCGSDEAAPCSGCVDTDAGTADGPSAADGSTTDVASDAGKDDGGYISRPPPVDFPVDPTFGGTGFVTTAISAGFDTVTALRGQPDGRILVAGNSHSGRGFFVSRFTSAGALDATFGDGGSVLVSALSTDDYYGGGIALQADGKVLVGVGWGGTDHPYVVRLEPNGAMDPSFGVSGRVTLSQGIQALGIVVAADGSSYVAGALRLAHLSAAGVVDTSFGSNGYATLSSLVNGLVIEPSGKLLTVTPSGAITRYTAVGVLDTTFGTNGVVVSGAAASYGPGVGGLQIEGTIAVQPDGKMLAFRSDGVARYSNAGTLDSTFGTNGIAAPPPSATPGRGALAADGRIFVATQQGAVLRFTSTGNLDQAFSNPPIAPVKALYGLADGSAFIARDVSISHLTSTGATDDAFGSAGTTTWKLGDSSDRVLALARQADGKLLALGSTDSNGIFGKPGAVIVRYGADGLVDQTFGFKGKVFLATSHANSVVVDAAGNIVVAGSTDASTAQCYVARYTPSGNLDSTFNQGTVTFGVGSSVTRCYGVTLDATGRIVVAGKAGEGSFVTQTFLVARLTAAGVLDTSFATTGLQTTDVGGAATSGATSVVVQADGKIVVGGEASSSGGRGLAVARYLDTGALDPSFDADGVVSLTVTGAARSLALQSDGKLLFAAADDVVGTPGSGSGVVGRLGTDGALDTTFGTGGTLSVSVGSPVGRARAVQSLPGGGAWVVGLFADAATTRGFVARLTSNGALDATFEGKGYGLLAAGDTSGPSGLRALVLQPDGKLVAGGELFVSPTASDFALLRRP